MLAEDTLEVCHMLLIEGGLGWPHRRYAVPACVLCALLQGRLTKALVVVSDQVEVLKVSSKIQRKVCADSHCQNPGISAFFVTVVSWGESEEPTFSVFVHPTGERQAEE